MMHFHVDHMLADGVYNLVPDSVSEQQEGNLGFSKANQDPN